MTINRIHKTDQFVQIPNVTLRDERLSFRARGILAYMLTHVDGWRAGYREIMDAGTEGRQAILSAFKELEHYGYRTITRFQGDDGKWHTEVNWYETPCAKEPSAENPTHGKSARIRTPSQNTIKNSRSSSSSSLRSSDDSSLTGWTICHECGDTMWNGRCWRHHGSSGIQTNGDAHDTGE